MLRHTVAVIGPGRLGRALSASFAQIGWSVRSFGRDLWTLSPSQRDAHLEACDVWSLCVPDDQLHDVIARLAPAPVGEKIIVFHSGTVPLSALDALIQRGARGAKLHPLLAFSTPKNVPIPPHTHFALGGSDEVKRRLKAWVDAWRGIAHELSDDDWLVYHLAAVLASNFTPLLVRCAADLLTSMTPHLPDALDWLEPLIEKAVADALDGANPKPFSGPAVRSDWSVIDKHLEFLEDHHPQLALVYRSATHLLNAVASASPAPRSASRRGETTG